MFPKEFLSVLNKEFNNEIDLQKSISECLILFFCRSFRFYQIETFETRKKWENAFKHVDLFDFVGNFEVAKTSIVSHRRGCAIDGAQ